MSDTYAIREAVASDIDTLISFTIQEAHEAEGIEPDADAVRRGVQGAFENPPRAAYWVAETSDGRVVASTSIVTEWSNVHGGYYWWVQSLFITSEQVAAQKETTSGRHRRRCVRRVRRGPDRCRNHVDSIRSQDNRREPLRGTRLGRQMADAGLRSGRHRIPEDAVSQGILERSHYVIVWQQDLDVRPEANRDRILAYDNGTLLSRLGMIWACRGDLRVERINAAQVAAVAAAR